MTKPLFEFDRHKHAIRLWCDACQVYITHDLDIVEQETDETRLDIGWGDDPYLEQFAGTDRETFERVKHSKHWKLHITINSN